MHLWPSMSIRNSFKLEYLKKLEWNLHRMKNEKPPQSPNNTSTNQDKLLEPQDVPLNPQSNLLGGTLLFCKELFMILSCCYCCFCCGVLDEEET